jgi:DNA-binding transcriptional MerR regulator
MLTIGALVAQLKVEFPDLTVSKVRYLEAQGLLQPQRTERGSRRYADTDVQQLRRILELQRDAFLPLAVIRERLDDVLQADAPAERGVPVRRLRRTRTRRLSADEVAQRGGVDMATLRELATHGLIGDMDTEAVEVCTLVARLRHYGIEPRHLRSFRVAADREVGLVQQAMAPRRGQSAGAQEREDLAELLSLLLDLHIALVRQRSSTLDT